MRYFQQQGGTLGATSFGEQDCLGTPCYSHITVVLKQIAGHSKSPWQALSVLPNRGVAKHAWPCTMGLAFMVRLGPTFALSFLSTNDDKSENKHDRQVNFKTQW